MPVCHIALRAGKSERYRQAILDGLCRAMREALDVPDGDRFITITEHDATNFRTGDAFGVRRSDDVVYIQITIFATRTTDQRHALFRRTAALLGRTRASDRRTCSSRLSMHRKTTGPSGMG